MSPAQAPVLSTILMAFNEEASLAGVAAELLDALRRCGHPFELVIVDDGSSDGTRAVAQELADRHESVRLIRHDSNRGLGGVYETGFREFHGELLTFFPADGQFPATSLPLLLRAVAEVDLVLGHVDAPRSWDSRLLSGLERLLYRALFGRFPRFQGLFMVRRTVIETLRLSTRGRGWGVVMELIVRAQRAGYRLGEVATPLRPRRAGHSKVRTLGMILANTRQAFALALRLALPGRAD